VLNTLVLHATYKLRTSKLKHSINTLLVDETCELNEFNALLHKMLELYDVGVVVVQADVESCDLVCVNIAYNSCYWC
jgi:hypothetical protein